MISNNLKATCSTRQVDTARYQLNTRFVSNKPPLNDISPLILILNPHQSQKKERKNLKAVPDEASKAQNRSESTVTAGIDTTCDVLIRWP